jgi:hypothetical protein
VSRGDVGDESQHQMEATEADIFAIYFVLMMSSATLSENKFTFFCGDLNTQTSFKFYLGGRNQQPKTWSEFRLYCLGVEVPLKEDACGGV